MIMSRFASTCTLVYYIYWYGNAEYESVDMYICKLGIRKIIVSVGSSERPLDVV